MFADRDSDFWPWLHALRETPLLDEQTTIAIGHPAQLEVQADGGLKIEDSRKYGTVAFTLLSPGSL
jgi:hypothetical protein